MVARTQNETFSSVDAAWWHMEEPTNMAMITAVMTFDKPLDFERVEATLDHRLLGYRRFRQRVKEPLFGLGLPRWEADPYFDIHAHLHRIALPSPGDRAALEALVGDLMSTPLDYGKPLWQWHLVEGYGEGSALIARMHHCIADGLALMDVLLAMCDKEPDAPWPEPPRRTRRRRQPSPLGPLLTPAVTAVTSTVATAESLLHEGMETLTSPSRLLDVAKLGVAGALALGKLTLSWPDVRTIFKGDCGVTKRAAWSCALSLDLVKAIGRNMDAKVNDVLLAAMAGGLRRYLEGRGEPTAGLNIRAMVPVSLRPPEDAYKLGNRFGLVLLSLPVGIEDPLDRLLALKRRMDSIKRSPEAAVAFGILSTMGATPFEIEHLIRDFFAAKATAVMTNVPGPRETLYFAGEPIRTVVFWVPAPSHLSLGLSIQSYAGQVFVGVASDAALVPDPGTIVAGFETELAAMAAWTGPDGGKTEALAPARASTASRQPETLAGVAVHQVEAECAEEAALAAESSENSRAVFLKRGEAARPAVAGGASRGNGDGGAPAGVITRKRGDDAGSQPQPAPVRCTALTVNMQQCRNRALPGMTVCRVHRRQA